MQHQCLLIMGQLHTSSNDPQAQTQTRWQSRWSRSSGRWPSVCRAQTWPPAWPWCARTLWRPPCSLSPQCPSPGGGASLISPGRRAPPSPYRPRRVGEAGAGHCRGAGEAEGKPRGGWGPATAVSLCLSTKQSYLCNFDWRQTGFHLSADDRDRPRSPGGRGGCVYILVVSTVWPACNNVEGW